MSATAQEQKTALPARGTSALRKKALLEIQIQREQADAERLERLKEDTLRKKKATRTKIINDYVNGVGAEEANDIDEKDENGEDGRRVREEKEITVEEVDEEAEEEEDRKMSHAEEAAYQKRKAEEVVKKSSSSGNKYVLDLWARLRSPDDLVVLEIGLW